MIDSHCHLDHEPLFSNLNQILDRSKKNGLKKLLTISTTIKSFENILNIVDLDEMIYGTIGIHPHEVKNYKIDKNYLIDNAKKNKKIIGIGETGLDFYYENSKKNDQILSFEKHIEAAISLNYPVIVHSRSAENETFDVLNNFKNSNPKILMHCFTGSKEFAKKLINLDAYFSASGIITFKNSLDLQETFKLISNQRILIETDSPFLAPVPMRGKKNEPSFIKYTLQKLSEIKDKEFRELEVVTNNNFERLFF
tara:strand:+ start:836 stop:1594 length:759 start_codon:yes stop_codon:yes gene_type:complete